MVCVLPQLASGNGIGRKSSCAIPAPLDEPWAQLFVEIDFRGVDLRITVWQANEVKCFSVDGVLWWVELLSL